MARIAPLRREDLPEFEGGFAIVEQAMGFVPNSMFTMARVPGLLEGFQSLAFAVMGSELVPRALGQMVAQVVSNAAGCRYCQAHTGHSAQRLGVSEEKLADLWTFETSPHFDDAERAALRLALHAGQVPNATTEEDFAACRKHFSEEQIASLVATISLFGYLNRWNDTMATDLEPSPTSFGHDVLGASGWEAGKHAGGDGS
jgi:AhpD family alkylhydroperoxidase